MPAECYWCKSSTLVPGSINNPLGSKGDAIGCCLKCQVLACGHHGIRDNKRQEFKCYDCLFIKLLSSALEAATSVTQTDAEVLAEWDEVFEAALEEDDFFEDFAEFKVGYRQLNTWFAEAENGSLNTDLFPFPYNNIFNKFEGEAEKFLIVAGRLISNIASENLSEVSDPFRYNLAQIVNNNMLRNG